MLNQKRVVIDYVYPKINDGDFFIKRVVNEIVTVDANVVITSYSIHYTKLYEEKSLHSHTKGCSILVYPTKKSFAVNELQVPPEINPPLFKVVAKGVKEYEPGVLGTKQALVTPLTQFLVNNIKFVSSNETKASASHSVVLALLAVKSVWSESLNEIT